MLPALSQGCVTKLAYCNASAAVTNLLCALCHMAASDAAGFVAALRALVPLPPAPDESRPRLALQVFLAALAERAREVNAELQIRRPCCCADAG